jgi:hypothetical protein
MKRFTYIFGVMMVGIMGLSLILPAISSNLPQTTAPQTQPTALPTFPPPLEPAQIVFDDVYMHPSGLFMVSNPDGWTPSQPQTSGQSVRAVFTNGDAKSVIQVDVDQASSTEAEAGPLTLDDVDARYNATWLGDSWRSYSSWSESDRERTDDDRLLIDFELTLANQGYVSRQEAWTDGEWIYSVRVVTPENATDMLVYLLDQVAESLEPQKQFAGIPFSWTAYIDQQDTHIIRYPASWTLEDGAPGRPTSISGSLSTALRVEAEADTVIDSEAAARAWVESQRAGNSILSVEAVERDGSQGYSVAYSARTVDGDSESGLALLLNGPDEKLHVANMRFLGSNVDLNAPEPDPIYNDHIRVMLSFFVDPELADISTDTSAQAVSG